MGILAPKMSPVGLRGDQRGAGLGAMAAATVIVVTAFGSSLGENVPILGVVLASFVLVALAMGLARWMRLGLERDLVVAAVRAAVQLLAVGFVLSALFDSSLARIWAWVWLGFMLVVSTRVVVHRARHHIQYLGSIAVVVLGGSAAIAIAVTFGFGVIEFDPISLVVVTGITIGNAMPSTVLGVNQAVTLARDHVGEIEAVLSLGFDRQMVTRYLAPRAARAALIPQIERTKVVGLIALPGAMTGLLLAGVDPVDAVVIQLIVMYLILGAAAVCVVSVVAAVSRAAVTADLRAAPWTQPGP